MSVLSSALDSFSVGSLLQDLNNLTQLQNITSNGWVGSDPMFSHMYIMQPALRNGTYIPRQLVKSVQLPDRVLRKSAFPFKGGKISYADGYDVGDLHITFYENQQMQISSYINAWRASIIGPAGKTAGFVNDYKYTMFFVHRNSLGNPVDTLTSSLMQKIVPNNIKTALQPFNFCGFTVMFGCFPTAMPYPQYENLKQDSQIELRVSFNVDELVQIPFGADIGDISEILGLNLI